MCRLKAEIDGDVQVIQEIWGKLVHGRLWIPTGIYEERFQ